MPASHGTSIVTVFNLGTKGQPPTDIDHGSGSHDMRERPGRRHIRQIRRIIDEQLQQDMETQQICDLLVVRRESLRQRRGERKAWEVLHEVVVGGAQTLGHSAHAADEFARVAVVEARRA